MEVKSVAIIGASNDTRKFGNKAVRAFKAKGYKVYPVNLHETEVEGMAAFKSIADIPVRPQLVSLYVPPPIVHNLLPGIAAKGCDELWLNPGTESDAVLAEVSAIKVAAQIEKPSRRTSVPLPKRQVVQHQVNDNACRRHVNPDRKGDFR